MFRFFDGIIFSANLLEITPSATSSLIIKFAGEKNKRPYIIDPMTYVFGELYHGKKMRTDLNWITSDGKGSKIKNSYKKLAHSLGYTFQQCIKKRKAISIQDLQNDNRRKDICKTTIEYQKKQISNILSKDREDFVDDFKEDIPEPGMIIAPYFFIHPGKELECLDIIDKIAIDSISYEKSSLYIKFCFNKEMLLNSKAIQKILSICDREFKGIWLWINNFDEKKVNSKYLIAFKNLIESISKKEKEIFNRHGSGYSMMLSKFGMNGISNGVGYGEKKDIMPVSGQGTPPVNYYFPKLYNTFGVPDIERAFGDIGVDSPETFFKHICDCVICKGVIDQDISNFRNFGNQYSSDPNTKKQLTVAATECTRYHYLLCKVKEKKYIQNASLETIIKDLKNSLPISEIDTLKSEHILRWIESLNDKE